MVIENSEALTCGSDKRRESARREKNTVCTEFTGGALLPVPRQPGWYLVGRGATMEKKKKKTVKRKKK